MKHVDMLKEKYHALRCELSPFSHHLSVVSSSCNEVIQSNDGLTVKSNNGLVLLWFEVIRGVDAYVRSFGSW
jgi:hypothetical protein